MKGAATMTRRDFLRLTGALPLVSWADAGPAWLTDPLRLPSVALTDTTGSVHRLSDLLQDRPTAISFFFTRCTTLCPMQTALLRQVQVILNKGRHAGLLLSISLDPDHDDPAAVRDFANRFHAPLGLEHRWLMLKAAPADLQRLRGALDAGTGSPREHANSLWIGSAKRGRWTRTSGLPTAREIVTWMEASHA